jgi:molybdopterin converting factor small subunit
MIKLRFLGHLAAQFNDEMELQEEKLNVAELLNRLNLRGKAKITRANTLILVNGVEVSALKGDETEVKDGDLVTLIPISHGG